MDEQQRANLRVLAVLAVIAACIGAVLMVLHPRADGFDIATSPLHHAYPDAQLGTALDPRGGSGWNVPIDHGDHAQFSDVLLYNRTHQPIRLLAVVPTWESEPHLVSDLQLTANRPSVMGSRTHVGSHAAPGPERLRGTPLRSGAIIPPSHGELGGIVLAYDVAPPSSDVGAVLGMDVVYELGGRQWIERFPFIVVVCPSPGHHRGEMSGPCGPYRDIDLFRMSYDDALAAVRKSG